MGKDKIWPDLKNISRLKLIRKPKTGTDLENYSIVDNYFENQNTGTVPVFSVPVFCKVNILKVHIFSAYLTTFLRLHFF